jgi:hypothetical protein
MNEQIMDEQIMDEQILQSPQIKVDPIVQIMANFMNYLSVSLYESEFTKNHEDSYAILQSIYNSVASTPSVAPSLNDCSQFYDNIVYLANVTYTDDPDYYTFKRGLRKYIAYMKL